MLPDNGRTKKPSFQDVHVRLDTDFSDTNDQSISVVDPQKNIKNLNISLL